jgi:uncharacterized Zn finger protein
VAFGSSGSWFPPYVPVAERRAQATQRLAELRRRGGAVNPVVIQGRAIATTFWGKAWCQNLESYSDYANRLPRGRTYARNGSVVDLRIEPGRLRALVSGSSLYTAEVGIRTLEEDRWRRLAGECAGKIDSVVELLSGRLSEGVMEILCGQERGLFPSTRELSLSCSCPDGARLCKHLAAVLYGVGARLDHQPELLFVLRGVDQMDLVSQATDSVGRADAGGGLEGESLSELFGIDVETGPAPVKTRKRPARNRPGARTKKTRGTKKRIAALKAR